MGVYDERKCIMEIDYEAHAYDQMSFHCQRETIVFDIQSSLIETR